MRKNLLLIILLFVVLSCSTYRKTMISTSTKSLLENKIWVMQFPAEYTFTYQDIFKEGKMNSTYSFKNPNSISTLAAPYYLSDTISSKFDSTQIGKVPNGKYIIIKPTERYEKIAVFEILQLDSANLILKNLKNKSILTYKAKAK